MDRTRRLRSAARPAVRRPYPAEEQGFLPVASPFLPYASDVYEHGYLPLDDSDPDVEDSGEAYFKRARMASRQLGDLPLLRYVVDFHTAVPKKSKLPPEFAPSVDKIKIFEARFGDGSYAELDSKQVLSLHYLAPLILLTLIS